MDATDVTWMCSTRTGCGLRSAPGGARACAQPGLRARVRVERGNRAGQLAGAGLRIVAPPTWLGPRKNPSRTLKFGQKHIPGPCGAAGVHRGLVFGRRAQHLTLRPPNTMRLPAVYPGRRYSAPTFAILRHPSRKPSLPSFSESRPRSIGMQIKLVVCFMSSANEG